MLEYLKSTVYFGNSLLEYSAAALTFIVVVVAVSILQRIVIHYVTKFEDASNIEMLTGIIQSIRKRLLPVTYVFAVYAALYWLKVPKFVSDSWNRITFIIVAFFALLFLGDVLRLLFESYRKKSESALPSSIVTILQVMLWAVGLLFIAANLGFNVSTFVAGLGIGGVAIALASQAILGDLFNYFVILFDKPFKRGDIIQIDANIGTVEYIGIKSTRLRSGTGEMLLISNTDLTKSRIRNYRAAEKRRCLMVLGVEYGTPAEKLREIPPLIKRIIENVPNTEFGRATFSEFGASSLNFELVYFVLSSDYVVYAETVQNVNYKIIDEFAALGVSFAFPSQTIYMAKN